jgi:hypothetical protein
LNSYAGNEKLLRFRPSRSVEIRSDLTSIAIPSAKSSKQILKATKNLFFEKELLLRFLTFSHNVGQSGAFEWKIPQNWERYYQIWTDKPHRTQHPHTAHPQPIHSTRTQRTHNPHTAPAHSRSLGHKEAPTAPTHSWSLGHKERNKGEYGEIIE